MQIGEEKEKQSRSAFRQILSAYERVRSAPPNTGSRYIPNPDGTKRNTRVPLPSSIDFVADVELAAKSVLDQSRYEFFVYYYLDANPVAAKYLRGKTEADQRVYKRSVQNDVGRAFISRGIFPLQSYTEQPSPVGGAKRCRCDSPAHISSASSTVWCRGGCGYNMLWHSIATGTFGTDSVGKDVFAAYCANCAPQYQGDSE